MYYTTKEIADKLPNYGSARTLLEALHNNQKGTTNNPLLKDIWSCRIRVGKRWLFRKDNINQILESK